MSDTWRPLAFGYDPQDAPDYEFECLSCGAEFRTSREMDSHIDAEHSEGYGEERDEEDRSDEEALEVAYDETGHYPDDDYDGRWNPIEQGMYDDDPSPYSGNYSED